MQRRTVYYVLLYVLCGYTGLSCLISANAEDTTNHNTQQLHKIFKGQQNITEVTIDQLSNGTHEIVFLGKFPEGTQSFSLHNPERIVIDVPIANKDQNSHVSARAITLKDSSSGVRSIRFGSHPEKQRIVIDLSHPSPENIPASISSTTIRISLSSPSAHNKSETIAAVENKAPKVIAEAQTSLPIATATPEPIPTALPTELPSELPSVAQPTLAPPTQTTSIQAKIIETPIVSAIPTPLSVTIIDAKTIPLAQDVDSEIQTDQKTLTNIEFGYSETNKKPVIRLHLTQRPQFSLSKNAEKSFRIVLSDYDVLNPTLQLPRFPPQDFIGFTLVKVSKKDKGLEIEIGVDRGVRLVAYPQNDSANGKSIIQIETK